MMNRADGRDREAALHKAMVERLRNGVFSDHPVEVTVQPEVAVHDDAAILDETTPARTAA